MIMMMMMMMMMMMIMMSRNMCVKIIQTKRLRESETKTKGA